MRVLPLALVLAACDAPPDLSEPGARAVAPPPSGGLLLEAPGFAPGATVDLEVFGADPGDRVFFGASTRGDGGGPCPPTLGGGCLDLEAPILLGQRTADASGAAVLTVTTPPSLPDVWLQAATPGAATPRISNVFTPGGGPPAPLTVGELLPGDLVISEVMQNPDAVLDGVGEWFEVYVAAGAAVDLDGLRVEDDDGDAFVVSGPVVVPDGGWVVFGASDDPAVNGGVPVDVAWPAGSLALANGDDELVLVAGGLEIDRIAYDGGPLWPDPLGRSMSLSSTELDATANDDPGVWCLGLTPYGQGDLGTPGGPNPDCGGGTPGCTDTRDIDGDGFRACDDCDDADPRVFPGAPEVCDGVDSDCDGSLGPGDGDLDGDGMPDCDVCDAAGFRAPTAGASSPSALRAALQTALAGTACASYPDERAYLFVRLDRVEGFVEGLYTGVRVPVGTTEPDHTVMNTEHLWPQSQGTDTVPRRCDLHHLRPADAGANNARGSLPFGEVASGVDWSVGGSRRGDDAGGTRVFEPRAGVRGDVARSMLYMHVRYGLSLSADQVDLFQAWSAADAVDTDELTRSLVVEARQGHANPFVTCPDLVPGL